MRYGRALSQALVAGCLALATFTAGLTFPGTAKATVNVSFTIERFYDELAPYGSWSHHPVHDYVWRPRGVAPGWRPYTVGNWVSTERYGWYWDSREPFAWAVYHYGRWGFEPAYGWYWVPGDTWAPAWVQWRYGSEYVGWAPEAPPSYRGYAYGAPVGYARAPRQDSWLFVRVGHLTSPAVRNYAVPRTSFSIAFNFSKTSYRPRYRDGYIYNQGFPREHWTKITHKRVVTRKIYRGYSKKRPRHWRGRSPRDVYAYAPRVQKGVRPKRPPKNVVRVRDHKNAHVAKADQVEHETPPEDLRKDDPRVAHGKKRRRHAASDPNDANADTVKPDTKPASAKGQAKKGKKGKKDGGRKAASRTPQNTDDAKALDSEPKQQDAASVKRGTPDAGDGPKAKARKDKPLKKAESKTPSEPKAKTAEAKSGAPKAGDGPKAKARKDKPLKRAESKAPSEPKAKPAKAKSGTPKAANGPKAGAAKKNPPQKKTVSKPRPKPKAKTATARPSKPKTTKEPKASASKKRPSQKKTASKPRPKPKAKTANARPSKPKANSAPRASASKKRPPQKKTASKPRPKPKAKTAKAKPGKPKKGKNGKSKRG